MNEGLIKYENNSGAKTRLKLKQLGVVSPDLKKLKRVIIDDKTTIYVPQNKSSKLAREEFLRKTKTKKERE